MTASQTDGLERVRPSLLVIDLDGTLVDTRQLIQRRVAGETFNFSRAAGAAPLIGYTVEAVLRATMTGVPVGVVTARPEVDLGRSLDLLRRGGVSPAFVRLGRAGELDLVSKRRAARGVMEQYGSAGPVVVLEDNPYICDMWETAGAVVVRIPGWFWEECGPMADLTAGLPALAGLLPPAPELEGVQ